MRPAPRILSVISSSMWWATTPTLIPCYPISSACLCSVCSSRNLESDEFLGWLRHKSGTEISSLLSIGRSPYGRALYANADIRTGDILFKVPFGVQLSPENLPSQISSLLGDEVDDAAKLAVLILLEKRLGKDSEWAQYLSRLPPAEDMHSTIFWSSQELQNIRMSGVYDDTVKLIALIDKYFCTIKPVMDSFADGFRRVTLEEFRYAYGLITSRAWGSYRGLSLIPFADFINHDGDSGSYVVGDESQQHSEAVADRDFSIGDEVMIRYGKLPNADLLLDFGFSVSNNRYDTARIELHVPEHDELHLTKSELLQRVPSTRSMKPTGGSWKWNSFVVKEVRHSDPKGKGIPQALRAFARVLICDTKEELDELEVAASNQDGRLARLPLKKKSKEMAAHELLLVEMLHGIDEREEQLQVLTTDCSHLDSKTAIRRKLAADLLNGEMRVLKSAAVWLKSYC